MDTGMNIWPKFRRMRRLQNFKISSVSLVTITWRVLGLQIWRIAVNILNKQTCTADKRWSSSFGVRRGAKNSSPSKEELVTKLHRVSDLVGSSEHGNEPSGSIKGGEFLD
jgi:hypothetical protein